MGEDLKGQCDRLRGEMLGIEKQVRALKDELMSGGVHVFDAIEACSQAMLAVRHLEDARMRLGKVLQWSRDGVSILDKPEAK